MAETHFEVLVGRGGSWNIHAVLYDEAKAVDAAKEQMRTGRYQVVKVMRNKFDAASGMFQERQVYTEGKEAKKSKVSDEEGPANFCWRIDDIYSYEGRLTLRRLMQDDLERWHITPVELIHCVAHVERLEDTGTLLQHVVQRVAVVQCQETGKTVQERMRELFDLAKAASEQLRGDWKAKRVPSIESKDLTATLQSLQGNARACYFLSCAISDQLKEKKNWRDKLEYLVRLLGSSQDPQLVKAIDVFVAEILGSSMATKEIFGKQANYGASLGSLVDLYNGQARLDAPGGDRIAPEILDRLNVLISSKVLPFTHIELGKRIVRDLKAPKALTDEDPLVESARIKELNKAMTAGDGTVIGGEDSAVEFGKRCGRLLTSDVVTNFLANAPGPIERVDLLLKLEQNIFGTANKRKLADYLLPLVTNASNETAYLQGPGTPFERLERLERLQRRFLNSELMAMHRDKASEQLDLYAIRILKEAQLFARIRKSERSDVEKALVVLKLCAAGTFTQGRALEFARGEARAFMKAQNFIDLYLAGSADTAEMARRLMELQRLLEAAGMKADGMGGALAAAKAAEPAAAAESAAS